MTRPAPSADAAGFRAALERLSREAASASDARLHAATCLLPPGVDPLRLWDAASSRDFAVFWEADGETVAGIGEAARSPSPEVPYGHGIRSLRWFGSVPFAAAWTDDDWAPLVSGGFVLPRWTVYSSGEGEHVRVSLAVSGSPGPAESAAIEREFERIVETLGRDAAGGRGRGPATETDGALEGRAIGPDGRGIPRAAANEPDAHLARTIWNEAVGAALAEIEAGTLEKVVLARRVAVPVPGALSAVDVLDGLRAESSGCFRFGLRRGGRAFVGASPECLLRKRGSSVAVEALAGTYDLEVERPADPAGGTLPASGAEGLVRAAEHLFASGKDLEEHALVVRGIIEALEPLALSVAPDDWPLVREARRLAHLSTTVRARLRPGITWLDLVDALHPTPAVGGLPKEAAVEFIRRTEPAPRGLFAAPIGWIAPDGDACLTVGIRSALLLEAHAWVYAGAGIVAASDPTAEWDETAAKLRWFSELVERAAGPGAAGLGAAAGRRG